MIALIGVAVFAFVLGFFLGACLIWNYWVKKLKELDRRIDEVEASLKSSKATLEQVKNLKERSDARS